MKFGEKAAKAVEFKLIGNSMILSTVEMLSETMTLAEKTGIGADRVLEWIKIFYPGERQSSLLCLDLLTLIYLCVDSSFSNWIWYQDCYR